MDSKPKPLISLTWEEGMYLDRWSVVHVLSGVTLGFLAYLLPLEYKAAVTLAIAGFILYEMFEAYLGIAEVWENRAMDVVVETFGFVAAYNFALEHFTDGQTTIAFSVLFPTLAVLAYLGWRARQRRLAASKK